MKKFKKLFLLFSIFFWRQVYLLIASFLTGNVFAKTTLGRFGNNTDIGPTVRFGNYPQNIFIGNHCSLGVENHIYAGPNSRSEEHTSELQSRTNLVCRLLLEKKKKTHQQKNMILYF